MPKKPERCLVICNSSPNGDGVKRRTCSPAMGAPYQLQFPAGQPVLLIGEDEIAAVAKDLACPTVRTLTLTPEQAQRILGDLCEKAASDEISKLRQRVAGLEAKLEALAEPVEA